MTQHFIEVDPESPEKVILKNWNKRFKEVYDSIPTASYRKKGDHYQFNLTWPTVLALKTTFKTDLEVGPEFRKWIDETYYNTIVPAMQLRSLLEVEGYEELLPHQRADALFLATAKKAVLANGLGTGKSRSAFAAVRVAYEQGNDVFPVFVACPNSTKIAWARDEIEAVWPGLKINVIDGTPAKKRKALEEKAHVYIINWEAIRTFSRLAPYGSESLKRCEACGGVDPTIKVTACEAHDKELNNIEFNTVIGDEIHRIKDPSAKVTRAFKAATGKAKYRFGLSGTPIADSPADYYSILNWLYPEAYPSKSKFIRRYCETVDEYYGPPSVVGILDKMKEEFFGSIDPFLRRMPKELILPFLPPIVRQRREVEMNPKQRKAYNQLRDTMIAELDSGDTVITTTPLTRLNRLQQFAAAYAEVEYIEVLDAKTNSMVEKAVVKLTEPSSTISAFMDDIEGFGDESVVVFAQSKQVINLLANRMTKAGIDYGLITGDQDPNERQMYMDAFQAGHIKFILCTIQAGGTGITLTKASVMVFLGRSYSNIDNTQAEGRGHRFGSQQHDSVYIIDYVTKDTVQEGVFDALEAKGNQLESILRDKETLMKHLKGEALVQ